MHLTSSGSMFLILRIGRYPNQASDQANDSKEKKSQTKVNTKNKTNKIDKYFTHFFSVVFHHGDSPWNELNLLCDLTSHES